MWYSFGNFTDQPNASKTMETKTMNTQRNYSLKIILIALFATLTQGCTIYWSGMVDNKSGKNIMVTGKGPG